jgi:hypothetical protein
MIERQIFTDSHAKSILTTMNNLRKTNTLCDVALKVEDRSLPAHRIVLAACSDYFCAMFTNEVQYLTRHFRLSLNCVWLSVEPYGKLVNYNIINGWFSGFDFANQKSMGLQFMVS